MNDTPATIRPFTISRTFEAPLARVWQAWTEVENLMQWFGPKGFSMSSAKLDFRPGGAFHYCLRGPNGNEMWGKFTYREIDVPKRIVLVNSFSDAQGGITRHPFSPTWPLEMLSTSTFKEEAGRTTITLHWLPLNPDPQELATFDGAHDGMKQGWTGTFGQLQEFLAKTESENRT